MRQIPLQHTLIWHAYLLCAISGLLASLWPLQAGICACLLIFLDRRLWRWQRFIVCCAAFLMAFLLAASELGTSRQIAAQKIEWGTGYRFCGTVQRSQGVVGNRRRILLEQVAVPGKPPLPGLCLWTWDRPAAQPIPGQKVCLTKSIKPVSALSNSREDSWLASLFAQDVHWNVWSRANDGNPQISGKGYLPAQLRSRLRQAFLTLLLDDACELPQSRAILLALIFGDRQFLNHQTTSNFASATLAHSLALSGQHLAIAALLGALLIIPAARIHPEIYLKRPKRLWLVFAAMPFALLYLWLGDLQPSLLRAFAMLFLGGVWVACGRSFSGQDLLCAALALILLCNPLAIFNIGLQMSGLCVAVILISAPALSRLLPRKTSPPGFIMRALNSLKVIIAVSALIQISLLPVSLLRFQIAGAWAPLNILWLPLLGLVVLPSSFCGLLLCSLPGSTFQILAHASVTVAALPCQLLLDLLDLMQRHGLLSEPYFMLPYWTNLPAFALLACAAAWIWGNRESAIRGKKARLIIVLALALLSVAPILRIQNCLDQNARIDALDVGQGQSVLVSLPGGMRILIDGGGSYSGNFDPGRLVVAPLLALNSAPRLSAVINSHPDLDHLGGLFHVLDSIKTDHIFHNGRAAQKPERWNSLLARHDSHALAAGDSIILGNSGWKLETLFPAREMRSLEGNAASLVLRLLRDNRGIALFPGDAEKGSQQAILAGKSAIQAEIVFAPHHGSDKNFLPAFYKAADPAIVIACCGFMNRWHYPGRKMRAWFAKNGFELHNTGEEGRVSAIIGKDGIRTETIRARN